MAMAGIYTVISPLGFLGCKKMLKCMVGPECIRAMIEVQNLNPLHGKNIQVLEHLIQHKYPSLKPPPPHGINGKPNSLTPSGREPSLM